ncbi:MAG: hypothetical protein ACFB0C_19835 [Leptolyngbyaceae cyanobacterium]
MKTEIRLLGNATAEDSFALSELSNLLEDECDTSIEQEHQESQDGVKDGGLVIALTIVGLAMTAVSTVVSVLSYWESRQKEKEIKYSVAIVVGNKTITIDNIQPSYIEAELAALKPEEQNIEVQVSRQ